MIGAEPLGLYVPPDSISVRPELGGDTCIEVRVQAVRLKPRPLAAVRLTLAL